MSSATIRFSITSVNLWTNLATSQIILLAAIRLNGIFTAAALTAIPPCWAATTVLMEGYPPLTEQFLAQLSTVPSMWTTSHSTITTNLLYSKKETCHFSYQPTPPASIRIFTTASPPSKKIHFKSSKKVALGSIACLMGQSTLQPCQIPPS